MMMLLLVLLVPLVSSAVTPAPALDDIADILKSIQDTQKEFQAFKQTVGGLARQVMLQQLFVEERIRSDGDSGIKQIRYGGDGTRPWHLNTITGGSVAAIHDHSNYDRTVGMGEVEAVLNGVDFRTRHNDYKLKMPHRTSSTYNAVEDIPFPAVPASVTGKHTVTEQVQEMREYFKAFHNQDPKHRDYKPYFKPVLCYLEGGWTTNTRTLDEPFESDRHFIDASSWMDLQEKVRFTSSTGGKSQFENYSFLPTTILNVTEGGEPIYGQWNYRIMCNPIKHDLNLKDVRLVDDLPTRMLHRHNMTEFGKSRTARYSLDPRERGNNYKAEQGAGTFAEHSYHFGLIDKLMMEVPGKDNYQGHQLSTSFGMDKYRIDTKNLTKLDVSRYHRWFKVTRPGAMGLTIRHRGFADSNMWVAKTSSPRVASVEVKDCQRNKHTHKMVCTKYESRNTYAVPLEIIWLTPLSRWNPYNLNINTDRSKEHFITDHGRNGNHDNAHAFNGSSYSKYYLTPSEFFHGGEVNKDPADTAKDSVGVLNKHGEVKSVSASGVRIFFPEIPGVGKIRQRYPIMPAHMEGGATFKNLAALQDIVMNSKTYTRMFETIPVIKDLDAHPADYRFHTSRTHANPPGMHLHDIYITYEDLNALKKNGTTIRAFTGEANGHHHELELENVIMTGTKVSRIHIKSCDAKPTCWDHHNRFIYAY